MLGFSFSIPYYSSMKRARPGKKKPEEINRATLREIEMSSEEWDEFAHGVKLFNGGQFWHAHEAWELIWDAHEEDERLFFQGLIQLAAAYHHLIVKRNYQGLVNNLDKAYAKLEVFQPEYLGVLVTPLLRFIEQAKKEVEKLGADDLAEFNFNLIPKIQVRKPVTPDLDVEIHDVLRSSEFLEGVRLFNDGYYWEAHETWEEVWRDQSGEAKTFTQAFVQAASAYSFLKIGKRSSAKYLFERAVEKFRPIEHLESVRFLQPLILHMQEALRFLEAPPMNGRSAEKFSKAPPIIIPER